MSFDLNKGFKSSWINTISIVLITSIKWSITRNSRTPAYLYKLATRHRNGILMLSCIIYSKISSTMYCAILISCPSVILTRKATQSGDTILWFLLGPNLYLINEHQTFSKKFKVALLIVNSFIANQSISVPLVVVIHASQV